jgi:putative DNA methylase
MIGPYPKRLIEVDLPIARISAHARREKSIRHGHISTLHIWWARRPLAACRAVILASLWPDPVDLTEWARQGEEVPAPRDGKPGEGVLIRPGRFLARARERMALWSQIGLRNASAESASRLVVIQKNPRILDDPAELRATLLDFIADFANWDNSTDKDYLAAARSLVQAAHEALGGAPGTRPLVMDPFAGGGAIPLEALRVGADAFASDLNPVAVLLSKVLLEYIPKYGQRLADEARKWGQWIGKEAEREIAEFYPRDPDGATPIAYLWARTIHCEGPGCGAEVPLIKSLWLGKKPHNSWSLRLVPHLEQRRAVFEIARGAKPGEVGQGTVKRGSATCVCCGYTTPSRNVRLQLLSRHGGTSDACLFCVVTTRPGETGRFYRTPTARDLDAVRKARTRLEALKHSPNGTHLTPREPTPVGGGRGAGRAFSQRAFGMDTFEDLFTLRQQLALVTFVQKVRAASREIARHHSDGLAEAVQAVLALNVDKMADYGSSLASWSSPASQETVRGTFSRQALSVVWDFAEAYPFATSSGGWTHNLDYLIGPLEAETRTDLTQGHVQRASATRHPMPDDCADAFVTDPPYYDAIPYADLSDFFIVWLKRSLEGSEIGQEFVSLSPKDDECVVDEIKGHDAAFFERTMGKALTEGRRVTRPGGFGVVVFAHKSTAGWEAQLQAMIDAGWIITGSWPIDTERAGRTRANSSAALASSVHLACRPRETVAGSVRADEVGDWREVLRELPGCIHEWMPRLAEEGVVGADAIFACLGPALEIFSRYPRVEMASGEAVTLKEYLEQVWAAVAKEALTMVFAGADASGFEADARLSAMWLWTLNAGRTDQTNGEGAEEQEGDDESEDGGKKAKPSGLVLEYDAARKIAQGLGAHLEGLSDLIEVTGETARLLPVGERTRHLFGKESGPDAAGGRARKKKPKQGSLFEDLEASETGGGGVQGGVQGPRPGSTVLDRVHQSMILFGAGRGEALKRFLVEDGVGKDGRFWRLADALAALYPRGTDERRWVEGVLARKKGLGF